MFRYQTTYVVKPNDDLGSPTYWNTRFQDIDLRINATESYTANINSAVEELTVLGIARIDSAIQPAVDAVSAEVNTLSASVAALQGLVVTDQNNITSQLNALLVTAQGLIANLQSLGTISDGTF